MTWFARRGSREYDLPFDMFDVSYSDREARRARRLESIYHVGQARLWDGREVLAELIAKHGKPSIAPREREALCRIFSLIMWGELGAWKISAQLADQIEALEPKLAASSQVHDEARHFYVMHDYIVALGERPVSLDRWSRKVIAMTLKTSDLAEKLVGMQLTIEAIALTIFQQVRELKIDPVLSELLVYFERDEARHVGLGTQLVPALVAKKTGLEQLGFLLFQIELDASMLFALKAMEPDLLALGVDSRDLLAIGFRKHLDLLASMREEFPLFPEDSATTRIFHGMCEALFPSEGASANVPPFTRMKNAFEVVRNTRESVIELSERRRRGTGPSRDHIEQLASIS
jgi:hypothetical protein